MATEKLTPLQRGELINERKKDLEIQNPDWHNLKVTAIAIKQLKSENLIE